MVALTPEKLRRLRRVASNAGFGILVFIIALYVWFPYGRAKELVVSMAGAQDLDVEIGSAGPAFGLGVTFKDIRVATRPTTGKPTRFTIDSARVTVSPFSLLSSSPTISVSLDAFGGRIDFEQAGRPGRASSSVYPSPSSLPSSSSKKNGPFSAELHVRDVDLKDVPGIKAALNLPLTGTLKLDLEIASSTGRYAESN